MKEDEPFFASLWDHISEFRNALLKMILIIALGFFCCLPFYKNILMFLTDGVKSETSAISRLPLEREVITNNSPLAISYQLTEGESFIDKSPMVVASGAKKNFRIPPSHYIVIEKVQPRQILAILGPLEGILTAFKVCFWFSLTVTSPFWLFFIFQFVRPALRPQENQLFFPFIALSLFLFACGFLTAYYVTLPMASVSLQYFNEGLGTISWGISNTIDFILFVLFSNGLAFESFAILFFLVRLGVLTHSMLVSYRRHAIVLIFVISAVLTPPDVISQVLLAVPLIFVYECTVLYSRKFILKSISLPLAAN